MTGILQEGNVQFQVLCKDARRSESIDLKFLTLPTDEGDLKISRSPVGHEDLKFHFKYLLATKQDGVSLAEDSSVVVPGEAVPQGSEQFVFTNAGVEGPEGPTLEQVNAAYQGTSLEGKVAMTTQGIQEWTVPGKRKLWSSRQWLGPAARV